MDFSSRDTYYRVIRSRSRGGTRRRQGVTDLQFQVIGGDSPRAVTGNSVRETQAKIIQTVGMDYDTFINSAFLLQGRADEFTNKTPADRKAVLAKIMGLETYDRLQGSARDRLNEATAAAAEITGALQRMRSDAEEAGDPTILLAELQTHLAALNFQLLEQRHATEELHATVEELQRRRDSLTPLQDQIQEAVQDLSELQVSLDATGGRVSQYQSLTDEADSIRDGVKALERVREQFYSMETARIELEQLTARKAITVRAIDVAKSRLETVAEQLERKVGSELQPKAEAEAELTLEMERVPVASSGIGGRGDGDHGGTPAPQRRSTAIGEANSAAERYKTEGWKFGRNWNCSIDQTAMTLSAHCARHLLETMVVSVWPNRTALKIEDKRDLFRQNQARLESLKTKQTNMESGLTRREDTLAKATRTSQLDLSSLELRIQESRQAQQDLATAQTDLSRVTDSLASGRYAGQEYEDLRDVDQKINALAYDEQARQQSYGEIQELQHFIDLDRQLGYAEDNLPLETAALQRAHDMLERRQSELERLRLQHAATLEAVDQLPSLQTQLESSDSALTLLEGQVRHATAKQGFLQGEVERLEWLRRDIATSSLRLSALEEDQAVYRELVGAFGRQGIQAMLIETVLPRLEEEANLLLGRMTDNRMQVQLETQRDRRSGRGDPIETLQINVTDELGPRAYEMYSGGEAFRVNLALRIGLSKVLSQRMGAPLPTLFIDEGFGSQDAAGRERILDVIGAIEGDFDKIIVITHLEDLKDAFPVRIEVQKGEFGSSFWLS